jgi:hypothetical protein
MSYVPNPDEPHGREPAHAKKKSAEDLFAYRLAVGAVGVALVTFLIGAAVIAAAGNPVPTQYWTSGSGIAGALLGILAPSPARPVRQKVPWYEKYPVFRVFARVADDLWANRTLLLLLLIFGFSLWQAVSQNSPELTAVAAASGGALVGMLAPPPTAGGQ